jgi:hypothetical protein
VFALDGEGERCVFAIVDRHDERDNALGIDIDEWSNCCCTAAAAALAIFSRLAKSASSEANELSASGDSRDADEAGVCEASFEMLS